MLGLIFYPQQVQQIFTGVFSALLAPGWALIKGSALFLWSLVQGVYSMLSQGATNAGTFVWNHTGGPIGRFLGL